MLKNSVQDFLSDSKPMVKVRESIDITNKALRDAIAVKVDIPKTNTQDIINTYLEVMPKANMDESL